MLVCKFGVAGRADKALKATAAGLKAMVSTLENVLANAMLQLSEMDTVKVEGGQVEALMREHLRPTKVNLASLGNVVPHLHWHVIARFDWDSHFPAPIWAEGQRPIDESRRASLQTQLPVLDAALQAYWA
jgi:diadenosine tetraphosphate (Ap4A) HIT family hydrolase